jgi:Mg2+ and Co2+ transporter CorA
VFEFEETNVCSGPQTVVGIPPTLVAGIYGMNFRFMAELGWSLGYPFALHG